MTQDEAVRKALDLCLIGGNHLGTHKQDYWPDSDADHGPAADMLISKYGVKEYDIWCCWAAIMRAAKLVRGAKVLPFSPEQPISAVSERRGDAGVEHG